MRNLHWIGPLQRAVVVVVAMFAVTCPAALAAEVLVNGNLESSVAPAGWSMTSSVTGLPGAGVPNLIEHNDGANNPPVQGLGILLHPQAGNQGVYAGQNKAVNWSLEQTFVGIVVGRQYTFKGDVFFQDGYSGIVNQLNALTPLGDYNLDSTVNAADYTIWRDTLGSTTDFRANGTNEGASLDLIDQADYQWWKDRFGNAGRPAGAPSPTNTIFEITFLNASDQVVGSPSVLDLRSDPTTLAWRTNQLMATAPAGANKIRVRVAATDMVDNCCTAGQDVMFDNFSLKDNGQFSSTIERLTNGNLNTPGEPAGWTLTEGPTVDVNGTPVTADSAAFVGFANNTPGGAQGLWLRPFVNTTQFDPDIPTVDAAMTQLLSATPGATYNFSTWSLWETGFCAGLGDPSVDVLMKLEFLNGATVIGSAVLDLATVQTNDTTWRQFSVNGVAPANSTNVRVSIAATGMYNSGFNPQSAFFDDLSLIETLPGSGALAGAVPEPGTGFMICLALGLIGVGRRNR